MIHLLEVDTLNDWMDDKKVLLIDVREREEYDEVSIPGSNLMPLMKVNLKDILLLNKDNKKIAIHCKSGVRSLKACKALMMEDEDLEVYDVQGGITAWLKNENNESANTNNGGSCSSSGNSSTTGSCSVNSGGCAS